MHQIFKVNAFVGQNLLGNPAAVCFLPELTDTKTYQTIAAENQLPVTAFVCELQDKFAIRWFTALQNLLKLDQEPAVPANAELCDLYA